MVVRDSTGGMLFGTAFDGVYHYQDGHWQQLGDASARHLAVSALLRRADGALWVGTPQTLYRIEGDGRVVDVGRQTGLPRARVTALSADESGDLWVGTEVGLYRLPRDGGQAAAWGRVHGMRDAPVRRLASDRQGACWSLATTACGGGAAAVACSVSARANASIRCCWTAVGTCG